MCEKIKSTSDQEALKNFLLDIECLNPLLKWTTGMNIFDVLRITRLEIRHSNMLAWILDPNENHALGDTFLRAIMQILIRAHENESFDVLRLLMMNTDSFVVYREWNGVDLLVESYREKVLLCIENKIDSQEHDDQLARYETIVDQRFPDYKKFFVYLTPDGIDSSKPERWLSMSYRQILELLYECEKKTNPPNDTRVLLQHYMDTVRREIVEDDGLKKVCTEIYAKHRQALDLIFENRPDETYQSYEATMDWCEKMAETGVMLFDRGHSNKTFIRFETPAISSILPHHKDALSDWNTQTMYFYEINNRDKISIKLVLSSKNLSQLQRDACNQIISLCKTKDKKPDWQWKTIWSTSAFIKPGPFSDTYQEDMQKKLKKLFNEIERFEKDLLSKWKAQ